MKPVANWPILYSHVTPWNTPWGRQQYLNQALSAHTRVFYLNYPKLTGYAIEAKKPYAEHISDSLTIIHDAFGFRFTRVGRKMGQVAAHLDSLWLHTLLHRLGVKDYIYWLAAVSEPLLHGMSTKHLVYDCIDPLFEENRRAEYDRTEFAIARQAQVVFSTAHTLEERMRTFNPQTYLLPNGVNMGEAQEAQNSLPLPAALRNCPRPIIGFMGTFDWRLDSDTLTAAAQQLPEYTFALVGRINEDQEYRLHTLRKLPNVVMPGMVSQEEGRRYTAAFDVGLIPFTAGSMGDAINPVKMYMYLAYGKPVVSTWIRECYTNMPLVQATRSVEEFVAAIRTALKPPLSTETNARIAFAQNNTWAERANMAITILHKYDLL